MGKSERISKALNIGVLYNKIQDKICMIVPTLRYEQSLWKNGSYSVAGVDEVGRGALAGPVVAAAVIVDENHSLIPGVRDSKTLSKKQKLILNEQILASCCWGVGEASVQEIDSLGIVPATILAMQRALEHLPTTSHLLIDGLAFKNKGALSQYQKTFIVKGDSLSYSIAAASIIAKVHRDALMRKIGINFPEYNFEKNVGYGTTEHLLAIRQIGVSNQHRKLFCRNQTSN